MVGEDGWGIGYFARKVYRGMERWWEKMAGGLAVSQGRLELLGRWSTVEAVTYIECQRGSGTFGGNRDGRRLEDTVTTQPSRFAGMVTARTFLGKKFLRV